MADAPHHSPPPTPGVPLSALLARADLGLRQIAGPRADADIHWVHTSEMADPEPYLLGGELLLTAGVHLDEAAGSGAYLDGYAERTVAAGAVALGFGIAPVHDAVPRALVAACDRYGLRLLEVPAGTPFTAVESAVWQAMTEARHRELTRIGDGQRALAAAAGGPDPVPAVLRTLARQVGGWAAVSGPGGDGELAAAGPRLPAPARSAAARLARRVATPGGPAAASDTLAAAVPGSPAAASDTPVAAAPGDPVGAVPGDPAAASDAPAEAAGTHLAAYALGGRAPERTRALIVAAPPPDPAARAVVGVAAVLLSLLTGPYAEAADGGHSAALVRLLLGEGPADVAPLLKHPHWTVVHARARRGGEAPAAALAAGLGTSLVAPGDDTVRALVPAGREVTAQPGWTLGVSEPVPVSTLPAGDAHAAAALRRAVAGRTPLVRHRSPGIGGTGGVAALVPPAEARAHAAAVLAPLDGTPALRETLRTWLSLHGSWDRTATALGIHRNTVRQRIARVAALLDTDPDDPDVRMELWFALGTHS
ncbi:PucR family transcriptional regulator [Streptomyces ochraceiscleroticus]|uniref:PucR family transcriptional regulator n=1 Tax=Streptomyces ochraceiscleroticus TaxID=47761 RepID=A0ABW1MD73_9ACTN|nr:PucR family transcriptional regulator [Streptomyces ochraceiscleroticus]